MKPCFIAILCFTFIISYAYAGNRFAKTQSTSKMNKKHQVFPLLKLQRPKSNDLHALEDDLLLHLNEVMDCDFDFVNLLRRVEFEMDKKWSRKKDYNAKFSLISSEQKNPSFFTLAEPSSQRNAAKQYVWQCGSLEFTRERVKTLFETIVEKRAFPSSLNPVSDRSLLWDTIRLRLFFQHLQLYSYDESAFSSSLPYLPSIIMYSTPEQMLMSCHQGICLHQSMFLNKKEALRTYFMLKQFLKYKGYNLVEFDKELANAFPKATERFKLMTTPALLHLAFECKESIATLTLPNNALELQLNRQCSNLNQALERKIDELSDFFSTYQMELYAKTFRKTMVLSSMIQGLLIQLEHQFGKDMFMNIKEKEIITPKWFKEILDKIKDFNTENEDWVNEEGYPELKLHEPLEKNKPKNQIIN